MANFYAVPGFDPSTPDARYQPDSIDVAGKVRMMTIKYTTPASAGPGIGDVIIWNPNLPKGCRIIPHMTKIYWSTGDASETLTLGDSATANRYLTATAITTAGSAVAETGAASGATYVTGTNSGDTVLSSTVAGAALKAAQVITLHCAYVQD